MYSLAQTFNFRLNTRGGWALNRFGGTTNGQHIPRANPGTDSQFPANCAGNSVSVPGLRRISGQLSPKRLSTSGGFSPVELTDQGVGRGPGTRRRHLAAEVSRPRTRSQSDTQKRRE